MVNHNQKGIKTIREQEVSGQIASDLLEWMRTRGGNGKEWRVRGVCIDLVLLTSNTTLNILVDERCKSWPPEFRRNQLPNLENTWVTSRGMIMVLGNDFVTEVTVSRNIGTILIG